VASVTRGAQLKQIDIEVVVPDPRRVLPLDVVTEIVRKQPLVALSDCACRKAKAMVGKDCGHSVQTCLAFNRFAQALIRSGVARQITHEEAIGILKTCEEEGLVHNVSNCEDRIDFICNCCPCSCGILNSLKRGETNGGAPSRYTVAYDESLCVLCETCVEVCPMDAVSIADGAKTIAHEKCIGCGLCVSSCLEGAVHLVMRENPPTIYRDPDALWDQIIAEASAAIGFD
jgi:formate hydrogenlyase subunit 6/NADH:ubiquinone oxidoreductase subunit I